MTMIRPARACDDREIGRILSAAFPTELETRLVELLRERGDLTISLIAEKGGAPAGYVSLSPVSHPTLKNGLGLAPVAVLPEFQRSGIGGTLIREAHRVARSRGVAWIVLLGSPDYYPRFGYRPASFWGLENEYGVDEPFMAVELQAGTLGQAPGLVRYSSAFQMFG